MNSDKHSGNQIIIVKAKLNLFAEMPVEFGKMIEVSLDCATCKAKRRTVAVYEDREDAVCIKRKHNFPAKIISKKSKVSGNLAEVFYKTEYWYIPFYDTKRKQESSILPLWGRISFGITCFNCKKKTKTSLQTNIVRPWTKYCECGVSLYTETEVMPIFETFFHWQNNNS